MSPSRFNRLLPDNSSSCRRELIIALDLIAVCVIAQLFLDRRLVDLFSPFQRSPIARVLSFVPDGVQLSLLLIFGTMFMIAYRAITGDRFRADRGMGERTGQ